jgi:hypothetical protein
MIRSRLLPASIIIAGLSLGCMTGLPSRFAIQNHSSQTLVIEGSHQESGTTIDLRLPPGATADLILREPGPFTGNIQAVQQRWSARQGDRPAEYIGGLAFLDDPASPGKLTMLRFNPYGGFTSNLPSPPPDAGEFLVVNRSVDVILVRDDSYSSNSAKQLYPNQILRGDLPPTGPVALTIIRQGRFESVIIPRDSDRTWEVR